MRYEYKDNKIYAELDTRRFDGQFAQAHKLLNMQVVADSEAYIPFQQGQLRSQVRFPDGLSGEIIEYYAPYAHYQYYGELYLTSDGRSWAEKGESKYPTGIPLNYHSPGTGPMWFEEAKKVYETEWIKLVKRVGGGG